MTLMCIPVYDLESYEYFKIGICRSLCHSFNSVNMSFVVDVIFLTIKSHKKIYFHGKFITAFF